MVARGLGAQALRLLPRQGTAALRLPLRPACGAPRTADPSVGPCLGGPPAGLCPRGPLAFCGTLVRAGPSGHQGPSWVFSPALLGPLPPRAPGGARRPLPDSPDSARRGTDGLPPHTPRGPHVPRLYEASPLCWARDRGGFSRRDETSRQSVCKFLTLRKRQNSMTISNRSRKSLYSQPSPKS